MPSDVEIVIDSSLTPTAKSYTVSANGYIVISGSASSANARYVRAFCGNRKYGIYLDFSVGTDNQVSSIMSVSSGDIIEYDSSSSSYFKLAYIKFIYSIKSAKKLGLL